MPKDPIQDVARLVTEVVRSHGADVFWKSLPEETQFAIAFYYEKQVDAEFDHASKS